MGIVTLKSPAYEDAKLHENQESNLAIRGGEGHMVYFLQNCLHLLNFLPRLKCIFKCPLKSPASEEEKSQWLQIAIVLVF